jgi:hypothetical protein
VGFATSTGAGFGVNTSAPPPSPHQLLRNYYSNNPYACVMWGLYLRQHAVPLDSVLPDCCYVVIRVKIVLLMRALKLVHIMKHSKICTAVMFFFCTAFF